MTRLLALAALALAAACSTPEYPSLAFGNMDRPPATPEPKDVKAKPPAMDPGRRVVSQDCSRPLVDETANLRCR